MEEKNLIEVKKVFRRYLKENSIKISGLSTILGVKEGTIKSYLYGKKEISTNFISMFIKLKSLNEKDKEFLEKIYIQKIGNSRYLNEQLKIYIENDIEKNLYKKLFCDIKELFEEYNKKNLYLLDKSVYKMNKEPKKDDTLSVKLRAAEIENPLMKEAKIKNRLIKMHEDLEKSYSEINFLISESDIKSLKGLKSPIMVTINRLEEHVNNFKKILNSLENKEENEIIDI